MASAEGAGTSLSHTALLQELWFQNFEGGQWLVVVWSCEGKVPTGP